MSFLMPLFTIFSCFPIDNDPLSVKDIVEWTVLKMYQEYKKKESIGELGKKEFIDFFSDYLPTNFDSMLRNEICERFPKLDPTDSFKHCYTIELKGKYLLDGNKAFFHFDSEIFYHDPCLESIEHL